MTTLIIGLIYGLGWLFAARYTLTARMNKPMCSRDRDFDYGFCVRHHKAGCLKPIGQFRDRTLGDAAIALALALPWPVILAAATVMRTTPKTSGEQTRTIEQQRRTIDRLTREIEDAA